MLIGILTLFVAWGVAAFGAVYEWGMIPLGAGVLALAVWQWRPRWAPGAVGAASVLLLLAVGAQLIPVAPATLERLSPATTQFLLAYDLAFANGFVSAHPVSIVPVLTARALAALALMMIWTATCTAMMARGISMRRLVRNIAVIATVVGVVGLAQKATFNGKLLWFWTPEHFATNGFGPFVNRNHFAGWMLLALSVTLGLLFGYLHRSGPDRGASWRERVLWLGTPAASPFLLTAGGAMVMACALVWTMSRSGIIGAACVIAVMTVAAVWRTQGSARWLTASAAATFVLGIVSWRGADTLLGWYGQSWTFDWRVQLWKDTLPVLADFRALGSGINTYGTLMLVRPRTDLHVDPVQAHNDYLQLAVEGGLLVAVPALLLLILIVRRVVRGLRAPQDGLTWWVRMGAVAGICGMAVQEVSEFSLQIPGVALLFGLLLALATHRPATASPARQQPRTERREHLGHVRRDAAAPAA